MKIILLTLIFSAFGFFSFAQAPLNTYDNYFEQVDVWNHYYDSVREVRYALGDSSMQGTGYSSFTRWQAYWDMFMPSSGNFAHAKEIQNDYREYVQNQHFESLDTSSSQSLLVNPALWTEIGPYNLSQVYGKYVSWYNPHINNDGTKKFAGHVAKVDRVFAHPDNQDVLYALGGGMDHGGGGLYRSTDGGFNWTILGTDQIPNADVMTFAIKPTGSLPDTSIEYLFIGLSTGATYRSDDNGVTWLECGYNGTVSYPYVFNGNPTNSLPYAYDYYNATGYWAEVNSKFHFTKKDSSSGDYSRLVVARAGGIYYSDNSNASITPDLNNYELTNNIIWSKFDLSSFEGSIDTVNGSMTSRQFVYTDFESFIKNDTLNYIATVQVRELNSAGDVLGFVKHYVLSSNDFGVTWSNFAGTGLANEPHGSNVSDKSFTTCNIEVFKDEPNYVYVATTYTQGAYLDNSRSYHLKKYSFMNNSWTDHSVYNGFDNNGMATQANGFGIDPNNENDWWFYTNAADRFTNGALLDYTGGYSYPYHADVRDILVLDNGTIVAATDGGIYQSTDGGENFDATSEGMGGAHSDKMAVAQEPPFYVASGFWHSGIQVYNPETEIWHWGHTSDGKLGSTFFLNGERYSFSNQNAYSRIVKDYNGFSPVFTGGEPVGSENIVGRCYMSYRTSDTSDHYDHLSYNNDDFTADLNINSTGITFQKFRSKPVVIPNEPDIVGVINLIDGNDQKIKFYTGANQTTPNLVYDSQIDLYAINGNSPSSFGGICFDSRRNGKHWIILKSYPDWGGNGQGRIVEYNTSTSSYDDITFVTDDNINGLPASFPDFLHINSIEVDRQTGVLYIGTTNGVYYLDRDNEIWRKYSVNVPLLNTELGIIYCTGELYASSQNRGIWKTDVIRNSNAPAISWDISSNETWNDRMNLFCTLTIKSGATLIVNEDIVVYGDQKIVVEPGARLVVQDSAVITSNCGDFWSGIEIWGDPTEVQQAQYQGMATITGGARIENANNAIRVWKPGDWNSMGGIVQATNASFVNNKRDVEFMPYSGTNVGSSQGNISYFKNCTFKTDTNFLGTVKGPHVSMFKVDGIRFTSCHFADEREVDASLKNSGIHTLDSKFKVLGTFTGSSPTDVDYYDTANFIPSTFTNLVHGVWSGNAMSQNTVVVDQASFMDCEYGVTLSNVDNGVVSRNKFDRSPDGSGWFSYQYGIFTDRSSDYLISGNIATKNNESDPTIGIVNQNSGEIDNEVYRNQLTSIDHGVFGYGLNRNDATGIEIKGLEYLCNQFTENLVNDEVFGGLSSIDGVKITQGFDDEAAGNVFTDTTGASIDYHLNNTLSSNTEYFYNQSVSSEDPDILSSTVIEIDAQDVNECKSRFLTIIPRHGSILTEVSVSALTANYEGYANDVDSLLFDLSKAEDTTLINSLEQEIIWTRREMNRIANTIIKEAALDSTVIDSAQFVTWIDTRNHIDKYMQLTDYYWSVGDFDLVDDYLDSIYNIGSSYSNYLRYEFLDFKYLKDTLQGLTQNGILEGLDSLSEATIRYVAQNKTGTAQVQAQNILCFFLGECLDAPRPPVSGEKPSSDQGLEENLEQMEESIELQLYPNPSSSEIAVSLETDALPLSVIIYDIEGRITYQASAAENYHKVDVSKFTNGTYFVVVTDQNGESYMKKLIKQ